MHIILIGFLGIALVGALASTVMSSKPSQGAIALSVSLGAILLIAYTVVVLLRKESEVWNYGRNIRPTSTLLGRPQKQILHIC